MRRLFLAAAILVASVTVTKAQFYVGGGLDFWYETSENAPGYILFGISPDMGYSFNNRWAVGLVIGFDFIKYRQNVANVYGDNLFINFYAEPYARFNYFSKEKVKLFLDGAIGISTGNHNDFGFQVIVRPGIAFDLTEHFKLVGTFGTFGYRHDYRSANYGRYGSGTTNGFGLHLSNSLGLGFYYSF
jgi:hypothetical protein